jgi:hypothetical protein
MLTFDPSPIFGQERLEVLKLLVGHIAAPIVGGLENLSQGVPVLLSVRLRFFPVPHVVADIPAEIVSQERFCIPTELVTCSCAKSRIAILRTSLLGNRGGLIANMRTPPQHDALFYSQITSPNMRLFTQPLTPPEFGDTVSTMDHLESDDPYAAWANDPAGEPSGPPLTLENIRERVQVGIDQLDHGEFVTGAQLGRKLGLPAI